MIDAGLTWVGPAPDSIERMGSKVESKKLMEAAGVPVLGNLTTDTATEDDLPLLVKASAGGGGRGMRIVRTLADLPGEIDQASAEAASAFGDGTVFVEPYVERGRHVEVQVWGDASGNISVLGERDCSIQRRHQKVVEEAPAPGVLPIVADMHAAARAAAEAISYRGAGTVEFLLDEGNDRFYFLEMNTRLQVEHPVTEAVTGLDLVELQLEAAEGGRARAIHYDAPHGHAIEVRLYAEDPAADYQPQSGRLTTFEVPDAVSQFRRSDVAGIRVDSGFESGSDVSTHYDAMLAKVIAWAPERTQAARMLATALTRARIHGVRTNRDQLVAHPPLAGVPARAGQHGLPRRITRPPTSSVDTRGPAVAAALALAERSRAARTVQRGIPVGLAQRRLPAAGHRFEGDDRVEWFGGRDGYAVDGFAVVSAGPTTVTLEADGVRTTYDVTVAGDRVDVDSPRGHTALTVVPRFVDPADAVASGSLLAPMPGTVISVAVEVGAQVTAGQTVLVLEAMKMQHTVSAPYAGVVSQIDVTPGAQVGVRGSSCRCRRRRRMTEIAFSESEERQELRRQVARLASKYGREYFTEQARSGGKTTDLWLEIGKNGYLGINIPEEYGGGGGGIGDVAAVCEELAAQGCPLLMMVVSPAICGTVITRYGTDEQKQRWLPGIADGTSTMAFAITEPDAGTNSHNITTTARRDGDGWVLNGRKIYISGVDEADNVLVVARAEDAKTGKLKPCLFVVPTDADGFEYRPIPMEIVSPELQFQVFIDDVRLPDDALVGDEDAGLVQLFAGLNPERIMAASFSTGLARFALEKATEYAKERVGLQGPDRWPPGDRAPAGAEQDRDRAGPADDAEGGRALRRG